MSNMYESYSEDKLIQIGAKFEHLTEEAQESYIQEVDKRGIDKSVIEKHKAQIAREKEAHVKHVDENMKNRYQLRSSVTKGLCSIIFVVGVIALFTQDDMKIGIAMTLGAPMYYVCYLFFTISQKKVVSSVLKAGSK